MFFGFPPVLIMPIYRIVPHETGHQRPRVLKPPPNALLCQQKGQEYRQANSHYLPQPA